VGHDSVPGPVKISQRREQLSVVEVATELVVLLAGHTRKVEHEHLHGDLLSLISGITM
jgi:hypothetical protein